MDPINTLLVNHVNLVFQTSIFNLFFIRGMSFEFSSILWWEVSAYILEWSLALEINNEIEIDLKY